MRLRIGLLGLVCVCLAAFSATAAHTQARLLLARSSAQPGETVLAGIQLQMDPGWHVYWKNPGDSGMPTQVEWQLPPGIKAGELEWPAPKKLPDPNLTTYIYENEVVLLVPITLPRDVSPGQLDLKAALTWLECKVECVPGKADLHATLQVGSESKRSPDADLLERWQKQLPKDGARLRAMAWWENTKDPNSRPLVLDWKGTSTEADFYPDGSEAYEVQSATERLPAPAGEIRLRKTVKKLKGDWPNNVPGLLIEGAGASQIAYTANIPVGTPHGPTTTIKAISPSPGTRLPQVSLWQMLLYAFLGGLILNIMPCVLPVIALKVLGFVAQAKDEPRHVRRLGMLYGLGVLVSFGALAALVIGIKATGRQAGWGMQFSSPEFVVGLTVLVTLVALNLFGVFEVTMSGKVLGAASSLTAKHGPAGAFFNGVLATILATPCTAPFLGAALGFAFAQPPPIILLVLLTAGAGLAAPYVLLSCEPTWLRFVPKPGIWMERFKVAMGFPMLATALWLLSLAADNYGERGWWLGFFLIVVALAAWMFGTFVQRGSARRGLAGLLTAAVLVAGYVGVLEGRVHWRSPAAEATSGLSNVPGGVAWQPWSPEAVTAARQQGRPVLVDFTAKWCLTCNTIVKPALEDAQVRQRLEQIHAVPLLADFTHFPDSIRQELNRFARAGVPLVLVYPADPAQEPFVLPEPTPLLPPSSYSKTVLEYLNRAQSSS